MLVGYHCHVFRTDKRTQSETICRHFGDAFAGSAELLQVPGGRLDSLSSTTSRDSAIGQPTSSSRENLTAHESFSSSYDVMQGSPAPQRDASTWAKPTPNPFLPAHRRTGSEGSARETAPPVLYTPAEPGPSLLVTPPAPDDGSVFTASEATVVSSE